VPQIGSALTRFERQVSRLGLLDLAVGYPEIPAPGWLADLWYEKSLADLVNAFLRRYPAVSTPRFESLPSAVVLEEILIAATLRFLGLSEDLVENSFVTFSGSVALDRALTVAAAPSGVMRLPTPIFDVIPSFLRERGVVLDWWPLESGFGSAVPTHDTHATIVVSPDNPSGAVAGVEELRELTKFTFIADQSFALLSTRGQSAPMVPGVVDRAGSWIAMWDTGKTFDLDDEKFGLLIAADGIRRQLGEALDLVQCALPRRLMLLMTLILSEAVERDYVGWLTSVRMQVAEILEDLNKLSDVRVTVPDFGGFAIIDVGERDVDDIVRNAAQSGLGLITTEPFSAYSPFPAARPGLRIPLIRDPAMVRESVAICKAVFSAA
jgi:aspartate/methionine/tyrosine aminotransferase